MAFWSALHCEHFWLKRGPFLVNLKITQLPCFLASFKISEYFYVDIGLFSFKNAIENLLRQFSKKLKKKIFFSTCFLPYNFFIISNFIMPNYEEHHRTQWDQVCRFNLVHAYWIMVKKAAHVCSLAHWAM